MQFVLMILPDFILSEGWYTNQYIYIFVFLYVYISFYICLLHFNFILLPRVYTFWLDINSFFIIVCVSDLFLLPQNSTKALNIRTFVKHATVWSKHVFRSANMFLRGQHLLNNYRKLLFSWLLVETIWPFMKLTFSLTY